MLDFSTIANTTGSFPDVVSNNVSVPGAADGTPVVKNWVDQMWGSFQALLDLAGLTPDAVSEAPGTSQLVEAIQLIAAPPGSVMTWVGQESDPAIVGIRALALAGQGIVRANYANLDSAIYCGNTLNASADSCYRADDAAGTIRNISGAYLILPDMRGRFLRGLDIAGTRDFEGAYRETGNYQDSLVRTHKHGLKFMGTGKRVGYYLHYWASGGYNLFINFPVTASAFDNTVLTARDDEMTGDSGSTDNTPYNMAVHFWIRY